MYDLKLNFDYQAKSLFDKHSVIFFNVIFFLKVIILSIIKAAIYFSNVPKKQREKKNSCRKINTVHCQNLCTHFFLVFRENNSKLSPI